MNTKNLLFDCETGPDNAACHRLMPPFDPEEVKCGNLGAEKKAEKIEESRASHERNWLDKAALRPETGQILAIGYYSSEKGVEMSTVKNMNGEKDVLEDFWKRVLEWNRSTGRPILGYNSESFDLVFITLRSRILGVRVPGNARKGRYWNNDLFHDLRFDWLLGRKETEVKSSLDYVAKSFGLEGKTGSGKDFAAKFMADEIGALTYLANDLRITKQVAEKLGYDFSGATENWEDWKKVYLSKEDSEAF